MAELDQLAAEIGVSGRTLRRAGERGTIRCTRASPRLITTTAEEYDYIRKHWPLLERALQVLRTRPDVRLAVLFGSVARGGAASTSDVDLLVRVRGGWRERADAALALEDALGRAVQLVDLDSAPALLLADVLREGRVLADRDGDWARLKRRARSVSALADAEDEALDRAARDVLERFGAVLES
jgi:predicted nucleotidyltransferase